jgi:cytochrome c biogenesis protein CcdA
LSVLGEVPLLLAVAGGLVAIVNPCGFAMLLAYLSFFLGLDHAAAVARALPVGAIVAAGFVAVFGAAGLLLSAGARALTTAIPGRRSSSVPAWPRSVCGC